ncbi:MAG: methionyl-tRNA formyltransferase [Candidatus Paceibacterota bacterium]
MRIIFMGASKFGFSCLEKIFEMKEDVVAIFSIPEKFNISYSKNSVKNFNHKSFRGIAKKFNVPFVEITGKMKEYEDQIRNLNPDLILVIGWYYMIPKRIMDIPKLGCVGIHNSLLPKYRGGAPLVWAIINGEKESGVSFFYFAEGVDNGDIIAQKKFLITQKDTIKTVYEKAEKKALKILERSIPLIKRKKAQKIKQDESKATYFPQRTPEDGEINWNRKSSEIYNFIRAQTKPYPGAFFYNNVGQKIKIWKAKFPKKTKKYHKKPGTILNENKKKIKIVTNDSYIIITDWKLEK